MFPVSRLIQTGPWRWMQGTGIERFELLRMPNEWVLRGTIIASAEASVHPGGHAPAPRAGPSNQSPSRPLYASATSTQRNAVRTDSETPTRSNVEVFTHSIHLSK